jgi:large subunit ribosomal protein L21e
MGRSKGYRRRTRSLLKKTNLGGLSRMLRDYSVDQKVVIKIDSTQVKGMPHRRFNGLVGKVTEVGRRSLTVDVPVGDKVKTVIARKEHVAPLLGSKVDV